MQENRACLQAEGPEAKFQRYDHFVKIPEYQ
jgi:hypothetical protein